MSWIDPGKWVGVVSTRLRQDNVLDRSLEVGGVVSIQFNSIQFNYVYNVHVQGKLLYHTPVMGTHSIY